MAHSSSGSVSKDQRRYARQAVSQAARVRFGEGQPIAAEIRDYCPTGLYVAFPRNDTPDAALSALQGTAVQVELAVAGTDALRVVGRVARRSPGGIGIFVATMPANVLQALRAATEGPALSATGSQACDVSAPQIQALQQQCTRLFHGFLEEVLRDFFQEGIERLGHAEQDEMGFLERAHFDHAAGELAKRRGQIEADFLDAMRGRIEHILPEGPSEGAAASQMALVEEDEFEDWLNLSAVIKEVEEDIVPLLYALEQRYSRLLGVPVGRRNNPFGPEVICRTFQEVIRGLDFSNPMRAMLYRVLGQVVSRHAPALYQQLNQTLVALQPAKEASPRKQPKPAAAAAQPATREKPAAHPAQVAQILDSVYGPGSAGASQTPDRAEYSLDRILTALNQPQRRAPGSPSLGLGAGGPGIPSLSHARPNVLQVVGRLQQTARELADRDTGSARPLNSVPGASLPDLLIALDGVLHANQAVPDTRALLDQIEARVAAGGAPGLAANHRQILDAASTLFARARTGLAPGSDIASLLTRLERPLLKLALQDAAFPASADHPARQMLNLIEQYAIAADDQGRLFDAKLRRFLYLLIDRVCSQADEDAGIFESVRDKLERVLVPILQIRRTRVARLQEASEGRARIRSARTRVNAALEQRMAGRDVPAILLRLLDAGWRQYLVLLEMRHGAQGEAWAAGLAVLDRLFAWFSPDAEASRTKETAQSLLAEIGQALRTISVDAGLLGAFMDELGGMLADDSSGGSYEMARVRVPPARVGAPAGEADDPHSAHGRLVERLRVGDWWNFTFDGNRVPMQLIWISQPPSTCVFANRSASNKLELSLTEISRQVERDLANPGADLDVPLIDRSEYALFDETYQSLVQQALHDPVTGLLNRKGFVQHLNQVPAPNGPDRAHVVGIIEFDQFRMIGNSCGADAAEGLTRNLATAVQTQIGPDAILAALRDDTLALLFPNCSRADGCPAVDRLLDGVKDYPYQHGQHSYSIGFNIGITEYMPDQFSAAEAIRRADSACITAKVQGRNRMQVFEQASPQLQSQEFLMEWAGRIDAYLKDGGLHLRCQQVAPVGAEHALLPYYEILLGVDGENGLEIEPIHFIHAVEQLQRAHEVDIWVMRNAFDWMAANRSAFGGRFAINLSATSLGHPEVMRYLKQVLAAPDFPADRLIFEITESAAIQSYGAAQDFIREIRRHGCKFSLDDFGSGFTSYAHLKNLRTDTLKIDGSFVKDMLQNPGDMAMVRSMNDIGHSLGLLTVAEYVESPMLLDALREIGVDYAQGYAIHKPCRLDELVAGESTG